MDIRPADLDALLLLLEAGDGVETMGEFPRFVLEHVPRLVPCDSISYNEVAPDEGRAVVALEPAALRFEGDVEAFARLMPQHPVIMWSQRTGDGRAMRLSDFLSQAELHELDLYREVFRPLATEYQMSVGLPMPPPTIVGVALNRLATDFDERDRAVLNLARPHLARIHRGLQVRASLETALASLQSAIEAPGRAVVLLDANGVPSLVGESARSWLEAHFGEPVDAGLPGPVRAWLQAQRSASADIFSTPAPAEPLVSTAADGRLVLSFLPGLGPGAVDALVLERTRVEPDASSPLTPRELEVLAHVAEGKRSREVATALHVQPSTVHKHLERIYAKLGVSTRTAAVAAVYGTRPRQA
ncbi:MAG: LuxR C-terminal-related transcriptional regulator [Thermoleophilia bacterium]